MEQQPLDQQLIDAEASTDEEQREWGCCKLRRTDTSFVCEPDEPAVVPRKMMDAIDKIIGLFLHGSEHARVMDSLGACPPCDLVITADFGMDMDDESAEIISFFAHLCGGKVHHLIGGEQGPTASRASESFHELVGAAEQRFGTKLDVTHLRTGSIPPELLDPARKVVWVLTASQEVTNGYTQIPAEHLVVGQGASANDFNWKQSCPGVQEWWSKRDPARTLNLKGGGKGPCAGHLSGTTLRRAAALGIDTRPAAARYLSQVATQLPIDIIGTVDATDTTPAKVLYKIEPFVVGIVGEHKDNRGPGSNFYCMQGLGQHIFPDTEWGAEIDAVANRIGEQAVTQVAAFIQSEVAADQRAAQMEKLEKDTEMFIACLRVVNGYRAVLQVSKDKKPYASITDEAKAKLRADVLATMLDYEANGMPCKSRNLMLAPVREYFAREPEVLLTMRDKCMETPTLLPYLYDAVAVGYAFLAACLWRVGDASAEDTVRVLREVVVKDRIDAMVALMLDAMEAMA